MLFEGKIFPSFYILSFVSLFIYFGSRNLSIKKSTQKGFLDDFKFSFLLSLNSIFLFIFDNSSFHSFVFDNCNNFFFTTIYFFKCYFISNYLFCHCAAYLQLLEKRQSQIAVSWIVQKLILYLVNNESSIVCCLSKFSFFFLPSVNQALVDFFIKNLVSSKYTISL